MALLSSLVVKITGDSTELVQAFDKAEKQTKSFRDHATAGTAATSGLGSAFGSAATMAAGFAGAQVGLASAQQALTTIIGGTIGAAMNYEQALADVGAATGATKDEMAALSKEALQVGKDTSKTASEAVAAFGELAKAGVSVKDIVAGVGRTTVQLAEATGAGVSEMAGLLSNALNIFKTDGLKAADAANLIAKAASASAISVDDYGHSMAQVGPVAKLAGLSMEDLSAAIGILGNNALKGSDAGTSLKTMLTSLAAPSSQAADEMERLGIHLFDASGHTKPFRDVLGQLGTALGSATEAQKAQSLQTLFGSDAIRAGAILLREGVAGWDTFKGTMAGAPSIAEQSAARLNTLHGQITVLTGTLETLGITIGTKALPALTQLTNALNIAVTASSDDKFTGLLKAAWYASPMGALIEYNRHILELGTSILTMTGTSEDGARALQGGLAEAMRLDGHYTAQLTEAIKTTAAAADDSRPKLSGLGEEIKKIAEKAKDGGSMLGDMGKAIDDLAKQSTGIETILDRQGKALTAVGKAAQAAFTSGTTESIAIWTARAHEMADMAGVAADQTAALHRDIDILARRGPDAAAALKRITDRLDANKKPMDDAIAGSRAHADALAAQAREALGTGGTINDLKVSLQEMVKAFLLALGKVPPELAGFVTNVKGVFVVDMSAEGAAAAVSWIQGLNQTVIRLTPDVKQAARQAAHAAEAGWAEATGSRSPSEVMAQYGEWWIEGIQQGMLAGLPSLKGEIARINVALAQLALELLNAEPFSAHAAHIEADIKVLEAWKNKTEAQVTIINNTKAALDAAATAWDGFAAAQAKAAAKAGQTEAFGAGGAGVLGALMKAKGEGGAAAGGALSDVLEPFIAGFLKLGIQGGEAMATGLRRALLATLTTDDPFAAEGVMFWLGQMNESSAALGKLSGETFGSAYAKAAAALDMKELMGGGAASFFGQLDIVLRDGGAQNIATLASLGAGFVAEAKKLLPPGLAATLLAPWEEGLTEVIESGGKSGTEKMKAAAEAIHNAAELLPRNLATLPPRVQALLRQLVEQVDAHVTSLDVAKAREALILSDMGDNWTKFPPHVRDAILALDEALAHNLITSEQWAARHAAIMEAAEKDAKDAAEEIKARKDEIERYRKWFETHGTGGAAPTGPGGGPPSGGGGGGGGGDDLAKAIAANDATAPFLRLVAAMQASASGAGASEYRDWSWYQGNPAMQADARRLFAEAAARQAERDRITVNITVNGPVGMDDLEDEIVEVIKRARKRGALAGVA